MNAIDMSALAALVASNVVHTGIGAILKGLASSELPTPWEARQRVRMFPHDDLFVSLVFASRRHLSMTAEEEEVPGLFQATNLTTALQC